MAKLKNDYDIKKINAALKKRPNGKRPTMCFVAREVGITAAELGSWRDRQIKNGKLRIKIPSDVWGLIEA